MDRVPRAVVEDLNAAWQRNDLDAVIALVADDCVFQVHVAQDVVDHAGIARGRDAVRQSLSTARANFDYILYRPTIVSGDEEIVRQRVEFIGTHIASGSRMNMTFRQVYRVENGLVVNCDEYHDAPRVEAFIKLADTQ